MDDHSDCFSHITDLSRGLERMELAQQALVRLRRYRDTVNHLERCLNTEGHIAEQAWEAEQNARVLIRLALDSLNELADSGELARVEVEARRLAGAHGHIDLEAAFDGASSLFRERLPGFDAQIFEEAFQVVRDHGVRIKPSREGPLIAEFKMEDGRPHEERISLGRRVGNIGRVGSREFFAASGTIVTSPIPAYADDDCHHERQSVSAGDPRVRDGYGGVVGAMAYLRDTMARHAHVARYFGRPHVRNHPVAVLVALAIVAGSLIVAGTILLIGCAAKAWSGSACDWGWGLLAAGTVVGLIFLCGLGGCEVFFNGNQVATVGDDQK